MSNDDKLKVRQTEPKKMLFKELTIIRDTIFGLILLVKVKMKMPFLQDHLMSKKLFPSNLTSKNIILKIIFMDMVVNLIDV